MPDSLIPLHLRRNPPRAEILAARHDRGARRTRQFAVAGYLARLAAVGLILAILMPLLAYFSPNLAPGVGLGGAPGLQGAIPTPLTDAWAGYATFKVHLSHYWPPLGGINCSNFYNGQCLSVMADGEPWQAWAGIAAACVPEWAFGTTVILPGGELFLCKDRGSGIVNAPDGIPWLDLMVEYPPVAYGSIVEVRVKFP
jgi:hypothetical protein